MERRSVSGKVCAALFFGARVTSFSHEGEGEGWSGRRTSNSSAVADFADLLEDLSITIQLFERAAASSTADIVETIFWNIRVLISSRS